MANSYSAPNFNIDTSTNVAGLTTLKGSAPGVGDKIYIYNGATLTVESALACLQIILGQTSAGAAGAGNRYGLVTFNAGVTVTFGGNATNTNSGILSNPTSADSSSLSCSLAINGTASSKVTFTNSVGANNTNNKYTFNMVYGIVAADYFDVNYAFGNIFTAIAINTTRTNVGPVAKHLTTSTPGTAQDIFVSSLTSINLPCDFRFLTADISANVNVRMVAFNIADFASGGSVDLSGWATKGTPNATDVTLMLLEGSVQYGGQCVAAYNDIRSVHKPVSVL